MVICSQCNNKVPGRKFIRINGKRHLLCQSCTNKNLDYILEEYSKGNVKFENHNAVNYFKKYIKFDIEKELSTLVGMKSVKKEIIKWMKQVKGIEKLEKDNRISVSKPMMHTMITGSPGVGKTVLARKLADIFLMAGLIDTNNLVEVSYGDIIGAHVGHTVPKVEKKIQEAMHGVFFLDEAYRLAGDGLQGEKSDFGLEALETIMQAMEDYKGKMIFILAGYEDRMESLFEKNEGLRSRIAQHFKLEDYTPDELVLIAENILEKKGYNISKCKEILKTYVKEKIDNGVLEGNGRTIRNMVEKIILNHSIRIGEENVENITVITNEDVENAIKPKTTYEERESLHNLYKESQKELEGMIGLHDIKMQMKRLGNFQYVQSKRKEKGMQVQKTTHHMMFLGEPGTGKTTVARIVGKMLRGAGVLSNGHFLEITKDDLTGSKIPTTRQVKKVIQKAKGGVLFLDEAYTLCNDLQGKEALDALNREMEENREDLVVIYAGYEEDMQKFIQANEGLASRIPYHFKFSSYNPCELIKMLFRLAEKEGYRFSNDATLAVKDKISELHAVSMIKGNGRWIRNLFDQLLMAQSQRIVELSTDDLETIEEIDVLDAISEMEYSYMENNNDIKNIIKDIKKLA